jgi:hypothetical protein
MSTPKEKSEYITLSVPVSAIKSVVVTAFTAWAIWILYLMVQMISAVPTKG